MLQLLGVFSNRLSISQLWEEEGRMQERFESVFLCFAETGAAAQSFVGALYLAQYSPIVSPGAIIRAFSCSLVAIVILARFNHKRILFAANG